MCLSAFRLEPDLPPRPNGSTSGWRVLRRPGQSAAGIETLSWAIFGRTPSEQGSTRREVFHARFLHAAIATDRPGQAKLQVSQSPPGLLSDKSLGYGLDAGTTARSDIVGRSWSRLPARVRSEMAGS